MLTNHTQEHLSHDELLRALVDTADLGKERRSHLGQCADCAKALDQLEQRLARLGQTARHMAPAPLRPFRLPSKAVAKAWWRFRPMWATGVAAAMVLALAIWWPRNFAPSAPVPDVARSNPAADQFLLDQVDALVDDALPPILQDLAATSDLDAGDGVIDWVVPPIEGMDDDDSWT